MVEYPPHETRDTLYFHSIPTPVPIFQREWEFRELLNLYGERRPRRVLEIGTFHGGTLYHWLTNAQPRATIVSVDSYRANVDNRHLYAGWTPPGVELHALMGDSQSAEMRAMVADVGPFDWIFIDADHYEAGVQRDWDNYHSLCAPGGLIALHDICPAAVDWIQVDRVWRRIQAQGYVTQELVCAYGLDWSGIGCVYIS
jgi:predicted O-methyltransferase YrrM